MHALKSTKFLLFFISFFFLSARREYFILFIVLTVHRIRLAYWCLFLYNTLLDSPRKTAVGV